MREQFGLDAAQRGSSEIAIPPDIGAKGEYDRELRRYTMRQDSALWAWSQYIVDTLPWEPSGRVCLNARRQLL